MALCDILQQQRSQLEASLAAVEAAIAMATSASVIQSLRLQRLRLDAQISHLDTLINQNCVGMPVALAISGVEARVGPAADREIVKLNKELASAVRALASKTVSHNQAVLKSLGLPSQSKKQRKPPRKRAR